ncbi:MAG: hypothetical protein ABSC72_00890 [Methylovirgula sp.]|jgi:hypothetical protein
MPMAENGEAESDKGPAPVSVQGATTPPREKPVIEGEAIRLGDQSSQTSAEEAPDLAAMGLAAASASQGKGGAEPSSKNKNAHEPAQPRARRRGLFPIVAAIVLGAAIAVGGAWALHRLDRSSTSLAALQSRIDALENQVQGTQALQSTMGALDKRVATLEQSADFAHKTLMHLQASLQKLQSDLQKAASSGTGAAIDLVPLTERVETLENKLAALDQKIDDTAAKFSDEMRGLQNEKSGAAQAAISRADVDAIAILAGNLRRKVEAGAPFADELAALENRGVDKEKLAALAPLADSGVPSGAALAKQFATLAPQLFASGPEPKGIVARLVHDLRHLIRIRKIGDTQGADLPSQVARIQAALNAGKFEDADREWSALPDAAKAQTQEFGQSLEQRVTAEAAAQSVEAEAFAALAKDKS